MYNSVITNFKHTKHDFRYVFILYRHYTYILYTYIVIYVSTHVYRRSYSCPPTSFEHVVWLTSIQLQNMYTYIEAIIILC